MLTVAVVSVLITAPLGAIGLELAAGRLLESEQPNQKEKNLAPGKQKTPG